MGRHDLAIFEIKSAAAVLDTRYYISVSSQPFTKPGWIQKTLPKMEKPSLTPEMPPSNPASLDVNLTKTSRHNSFLPNVDVESISSGSESSTILGSMITILIDDCRDSPIESKGEKLGKIVSQIREHWSYVRIVIGVKAENLGELSKVQNGNDVIVTDVSMLFK